ncbi:protein-disulfide reductase DsbD [Pseudidiomarina sp. 1APR75-15]|uniref:Thiol:disulfide interchange protein DsbD n=1 Tax=Pseudidiomarina terrestris TaxID=2820060 RepID=A0ABT8MI02_9GAMM|nr:MULTISPECIES: protein-disulfide reductase DsbD [unclassified Pseudidiomarina]MDN7129473.1 protein-disulfide reductase DsbD [Pseudidiomarina sp. 1APR75-15]MDN7138267.1 protein-disulfide reductase DsbD [Pseudidiomarina sp. 1ASP75-14]
MSHSWIALISTARFSAFALFTLLALSLTAAPKSAAAQDFANDSSDPFAQSQFLPVDEAFQFDFRQDGKRLILQFTIADGYYLYQHRFSFDQQVPLAQPVDYPAGESHYDEFFGESIIYRQQLTLPLVLANTSAESFTVTYQGCADAGLCYPPTSKTLPLSAVTDSVERAIPDATSQTADAVAINVEQVAANSQEFSTSGLFNELNEQPLLWLLGLFLLAGLGLAFTPCVLPMYPILSTIIMGPQKRLSTRRAFTLSFAYVQGMAVTYSLLGVVVAFAGLRFQAMLQHPLVLIVLAVLFVALALSMLGVYTLQLPGSWQNYLNQISQRQRGGAHRSVFVMGALSGLIASPCTTAPLSGALLFIAQTGDYVVGASVLYALSIGMGIPLILFGTTGGKLLPKAGAWMTIIKRAFGIILLAVAVLFIERLLPLHLADWLWVVFISLSALFLIVSTVRDSDGLAGITLSSLWLVLAAWLLVLWWPQGEHQRLPFISVDSAATIEQQVSSASEDQLVMLDLYADWCVACKEFERYTFSNPQVQNALADAILLQADVTANSADNNAILQRYRVLGLPTILFFRNGELLQGARIAGYLDAQDFLNHLQELEKAQELP